MTLFRTAEPVTEPVTLADVKAHLRFDGDREDTLLATLIRAARADVEQATGCALMEQDWRLVLDAWPNTNVVALRLHPVQAITAVTVFDRDGTALLLDPASVLLDPSSRPARLLIDPPPFSRKAINGIEVDLRAGFGTAGAEVPDLLKRAVILLAAHWFEFRADLGPELRAASVPRGFERLIAPYRLRRL